MLTLSVALWFYMIRRPPQLHLTATRFPDTTLCRTGPPPCGRAPPAPCVGCAAASELPALRRNKRADGHGHLPLCSTVRGNRSRLVRCAITVPFVPLAQRASGQPLVCRRNVARCAVAGG